MHERKWGFLQRFGEEPSAGGEQAPDAGVQEKPSFEELLKQDPEYKAAYDARVRRAVEGRFRQNREQGRDGRFREALAQAAALEGQIPGFRLERELRSPVFGTLLAKGTPPEAAYALAHQDRLLQRAMAYAICETRSRMAQSLRMGAMRPAEGSGSASAPVSPDPRTMSQRDRRQVREAVAKGKKIYW